MSVGQSAFNYCLKLKIICYGGTAEQFAVFSIEGSNTPFTTATVYYYTEDASKPNGWYCDENGNAVVWPD